MENENKYDRVHYILLTEKYLKEARNTSAKEPTMYSTGSIWTETTRW